MAEEDKYKGIIKYILLTWLLCGTLDGLSAIVLNPKVPPAVIFKYISSGFFGKPAYAGGTDMVVTGVLFHYFIALVFTTLLFRFYCFFIDTFKNKYGLMIIYGLLIWAVMNLIVVPLSHVKPQSFEITGVLKNMGALIFAFGIPIPLIASQFFKSHVIADD